MKKNMLYGLIGLFLIGIVATTGLVSADGFRNITTQNQIEKDNYQRGQRSQMNLLTEDHFEKHAQRYQNREKNQEERKLMREALENNDFDAWKTVAQELDHYPVDIETINQEDFDLLVKLHEARVSGNVEEAQEFADELGWEQPMGHGPRNGFNGKRNGACLE